jgi:hypothetical protein
MFELISFIIAGFSAALCTSKWLHGEESFLRNWYSPFMEGDDSLPYSQKPTTWPRLEALAASPHNHNLFLWGQF